MATNTEKIVVQVVVKGDKQLDNLDKKTGKATKSVGGLTKGMAKMAGGVALAAAAFRGISKVVSSAISTFKDFEFQMAKVKAVSGASSLDFQKLSQSAEELGRSTFFTATQVAELQTNYAKLGFTTKEILQAQEATLLLATATGSDLARAAIVAGAAVRGFGLDASETGRVTDVMTLAFASSALDIEKWQTSMTKVAPIAESMNIPLENTAAIMGALTDAGIEASIAGTSMRNIFLKMKDPTSKLSKFLGFTVNSADDLTKAMDKLQTAGDKTLDSLVNIRQVAAFNVMVKGSERIQQLTERLLDAEGAAKRMSDIIGDNLEGATRRFNSAWEGLLINFTDSVFGDKIKNVVDKMASLFNVVSDFIDIPVSEKLEEQRTEMNLLGGAIQRVWEDEKQRVRLIEELQIKYPEYFKDLNAEKVAYEDLEVAMSGANGEFLKTIQQQVMREEVALMTKEIREQKKAQEESSKSIVGMLTGTKKVGTTFLKTTNALSTLREAQDELNQQWRDGKIDAQELMAAETALAIAHAPASLATQKLTALEEKRAEVLKEINDLVGDGGKKGKKKVIGGGGGDNAVIIETKDRNEALLDLQLEYATLLQDQEGMSLEEREINMINLENRFNKEKLQVQLDYLQARIDNDLTTEEERVGFRQQISTLELTEEQRIQGIKLDNIKKEKDANIGLQNAKAAALRGYLDIAAGFAKEDSALAKGIFLIQQVLAVKEVIMKNLQANAVITAAATAAAIPSFGASIATGATLIATNNTMSALSIAGIVAQTVSGLDKKAKGGMIEEFANGGMVNGKSHAQGGEKFAVGGRVVELEGGEAVINKRSTSMFSSQLSAMNAAGGGVKFADGGLLNQPSFSQQQFNALGQNQMMGAMGNSGKVTVVEADITSSQNTVSVIQSQATI